VTDVVALLNACATTSPSAYLFIARQWYFDQDGIGIWWAAGKEAMLWHLIQYIHKEHEV